MEIYTSTWKLKHLQDKRLFQLGDESNLYLLKLMVAINKTSHKKNIACFGFQLCSCIKTSKKPAAYTPSRSAKPAKKAAHFVPTVETLRRSGPLPSVLRGKDLGRRRGGIFVEGFCSRSQPGKHRSSYPFF